MKHKICIVADVPNWAFDKIAQKIKKELSHKYDIRIDYFNRRTEAEYFYELIERNNDCDLIHFLNRRMLLLLETPTFKKKVESAGKNLKEYILRNKERFSTAVNDHIDLNPKGIQKLKSIYNDYTKMYYTSSKKLYNIYSNIKEFKSPETMIHDICDEKKFLPTNLERFNNDNIMNRKIIIGWVGNSTHSGQKDVDLKGFQTLIKPIAEELKEEGYNIEGYFADRNEKWRTEQEMVEYYSKIDLYICASLHEGTPFPILEAMHCGVPIISTDVGIVEEVIGTQQRKFVVGNRENGQNDKIIKNILKEKIIELYNNREMLKKLSEENIDSIKKINGEKNIKEFEKFFDKCLSK